MSTLFSWSRWLGLFGRTSSPNKVGKRLATRKRQPDFADYGTAFGLEMSLASQASAEQTHEQAAKPAALGQLGKVVVPAPVAPAR